MEIIFCGANCIHKLKSQFCQNNESRYNVSSYKSNNLSIVYLRIYFITIRATVYEKKKSIINLATFYLVHRIKLCHVVMCNRPCHVTCLVTKVNKPGRPNFCDSWVQSGFQKFQRMLNKLESFTNFFDALIEENNWAEWEWDPVKQYKPEVVTQLWLILSIALCDELPGQYDSCQHSVQ